MAITAERLELSAVPSLPGRPKSPHYIPSSPCRRPRRFFLFQLRLSVSCPRFHHADCSSRSIVPIEFQGRRLGASSPCGGAEPPSFVCITYHQLSRVEYRDACRNCFGAHVSLQSDTHCVVGSGYSGLQGNNGEPHETSPGPCTDGGNAWCVIRWLHRRPGRRLSPWLLPLLIVEMRPGTAEFDMLYNKLNRRNTMPRRIK